MWRLKKAALVLHNELSPACDLKPGWIEYIEPTKQARPCPPARPARRRRDASLRATGALLPQPADQGDYVDQAQQAQAAWVRRRDFNG